MPQLERHMLSGRDKIHLPAQQLQYQLSPQIRSRNTALGSFMQKALARKKYLFYILLAGSKYEQHACTSPQETSTREGSLAFTPKMDTVRIKNLSCTIKITKTNGEMISEHVQGSPSTPDVATTDLKKDKGRTQEKVQLMCFSIDQSDTIARNLDVPKCVTHFSLSTSKHQKLSTIKTSPKESSRKGDVQKRTFQHGIDQNAIDEDSRDPDTYYQLHHQLYTNSVDGQVDLLKDFFIPKYHIDAETPIARDGHEKRFNFFRKKGHAKGKFNKEGVSTKYVYQKDEDFHDTYLV
ncbi:hypothetical protein BJ508DRAFT_313215 [Ascobolus immersus RN42]|uniref:Uncharacterized protein n=1 Tax=Ascobolus immersus RN42 TaxID=1160509 RepID=A0A3N4HJI4_ASCIM|nr:hypothetical protein BJ508DRAFT_313215 [Ascobolus immersus RN42]